MDYYNKIKSEFISNEVYKSVKDYYKNRNDLRTYYNVVELKVTELIKEHLGQIQVYMNYINKNMNTLGQNDTIGIIVCKRENKFVMGYCCDFRIYETTYMLVDCK